MDFTGPWIQDRGHPPKQALISCSPNVPSLEFSGQHIPNITYHIGISKGESGDIVYLILSPDEGYDLAGRETPCKLIRLAGSSYRRSQGTDSRMGKSLGLRGWGC